LRDKFLRLKFNDILQFENFAEKLSDFFASLPLSGKWHVFRFRQLRTEHLRRANSRKIEYRPLGYFDKPVAPIACFLVRSWFFPFKATPPGFSPLRQLLNPIAPPSEEPAGIKNDSDFETLQVKAV
jgi:hypothetical protein